MHRPFDPSSAEKVSLYRSVFNSRNPTRRYLHHRRNELVGGLVGKYGGGGRFLEVGIGANLYADPLRAHSRKLVRIDIEMEFIRFARHESEGVPPPHPLFIAGNVMHLPFKARSFDLILFSEVLEHLPPGASTNALSELKRILAPSGVIVLSTPQKFSPIECIIRLATLPVFRPLAKLLYREPVIDNEHTNLLSRPALLKKLDDTGLRVIEAKRCGMYIPLFAELGGEWAAGMEKALEDKIEKSFLGHLLWTQIYVLAGTSGAEKSGNP